MEERRLTSENLATLATSCVANMKTYVRVGIGFEKEAFLLAQVLYKIGLSKDFSADLEKTLVAYNNIYLENSLNSQTLRPFLTQGIPLVSYLSSHFHTNEDGFFRIMREGMISFREVKLALIQIFYSV